MKRTRASAPSWLFLLAIVSLLFSACEPGNLPFEPESSREETFPVDLTFREFYNLLGGESQLGPAIGAAVETGGVKFQYTQNAALRYDPGQPVEAQFSLLPIGEELGVEDLAVALPEQEGQRIIAGFVIYPEFTAPYDAMQAERFAGRPLTQPRVNYARGRIEQYFANLGFYRRLSDPPGSVHLLAYGEWKCPDCAHPAAGEARVSSTPIFAEPMLSARLALGEDFTGRPLSAPILAADGLIEQVYENFVVTANPAALGSIALRPITAGLGIAEQPLVPKVDDARLVFYPLDGELGHLVPLVFEQYLTQHGGTPISGPPTTEIFPSGAVYRQCFSNLCLDFDSAAAENARVHLAPLGYEVLKLNPDLQAAYDRLVQSVPANQMAVSEAHALITSSREQQITVLVTEADSQAPVIDAEAELQLNRPDGKLVTYAFPPTDASGQASLSLPAIKAPNGTLVPYQVCLKSTAERCTSDSYLIWGN